MQVDPARSLAIVHADLPEVLAMAGERTDVATDAAMRTLRVIMPLHRDQIYFIVRADSKFEFIDDIVDARINLGPPQSEAARTAAALYRLLSGTSVTAANTTFLPAEDALVRLVSDGSLDVVVLVATPPARLLAEMKPESRQYIKLLKVDRNHPSTRRVLAAYTPATISAAMYPNIVGADIPGFAVANYLVTSAAETGDSARSLSRFAESLCRNAGPMQRVANARWGDVPMTFPPLGNGWRYYPPTLDGLRVCGVTEPALGTPR
jgi:TRAP-type uncharacterized transport system substrate-binding protein